MASNVVEVEPREPVWVEAAAARVRRYVRCLRCPRDEVDDVVQETLLAALQRDDEPPLGWLLITARNVWYQHCRSRRRYALVRELPELHERALRVLDEDGGDWRVEALAKCARELSPRAQLVLHLRYRDGLRPSEIGQLLGLSEAGTKSMLSRTKAALTRCVERRRERDA